MKRKLLLLAAAVALAVALTALPIAASGGGAKGKRIVISERMMLVAPDQQSGTFVAAGAVNDAGPGTATFTVVPRDSFGLLRGTHVLTGSEGTITIRTRARVSPFPPPATPRAFAAGRWWILDATGAYEDMRGRGRITATADFTTGEITIMRIGRVRT